ncbi:AAA family ATPase [Bacillus sp. NTK074B]|uniref:ATP-binding cassette domain-containing protein n=1 Tax=Bacillus sp. NTK074B TaxID=2802174 RepID=UPI001A8E680C|nr:AAA family ATPase [Bacillus sp. NTK074B]
MKIDSLTHLYKKQSNPVLDHLSINFDPHKLNVIVGLNGAGKTTLLDILTGALHSNHYQPFYKEEEIVYQLQGTPLPSILKGKDIIRLILKCDSTAPFDTIMEKYYANLNHREQELIKRLWTINMGDMSVGERRWLIIRSICQLNRKLYIFDEPTAGIDPDARNNIINSIEKLVGKDKIVIMSTHILHELEFTNCKIHFLHKGKILFEGSYQAFISRYHTKNPDIAFQNFILEHGGEQYAKNLSS